MKKFHLSFFLVLAVTAAGAQEIVTASAFLERLSDRYAGIKDYEANIAIRSGTTTMNGQISYLNPFFMRIDCTTPAEQVIVFNGQLLSVYLPGYRAVLNQEVAVMGASMASAQGLVLFRRYYVPSYVSGPDPVPLDEGSGEMVIKLRLTRASVLEGFREVILSVDLQTMLIRRMEGRTIAEALVRFDFSNIRTNVGIPEGRFIYDAPATASMYNNFLFRDND